LFALALFIRESNLLLGAILFTDKIFLQKNVLTIFLVIFWQNPPVTMAVSKARLTIF
jgi:hypothetical protein